MVKVKTCLASELPRGTVRGMNILGRPVLLANVDGNVYAVDGICPNDGGNLAGSSLIGYILKCPLDGSSFDVRDGRLVKEPWLESGKRFGLRPYPTSVESGCILLDI